MESARNISVAGPATAQGVSAFGSHERFSEVHVLLAKFL